LRRFVFILIILSKYNLNAQNVFIDEINLQEKYRIKQLMRDSSIKNSFFYRNTQLYQISQYVISKNKHSIKVFSGIDIQNNSLLPISYNDGNLYPARGSQSRYSIGINYINKILDINLQPEIINNQNKLQEYYAGNVNDGNFAARYF